MSRIFNFSIKFGYQQKICILAEILEKFG